MRIDKKIVKFTLATVGLGLLIKFLIGLTNLSEWHKGYFTGLSFLPMCAWVVYKLYKKK